jgi:single-strand DNA-binding protein
MAANNNCTFKGNLTRDPESRSVGEKTLTSFSIAVNGRKRKDGRQDVVFIELEAWEKTAELIRDHFVKGDPILVQAEAKLDSWDDKTTGEKRTKTRFRVSEFDFISGKNKPEKSVEVDEDEEETLPPRKPAKPPKKRVTVEVDDDDEDDHVF